MGWRVESSQKRADLGVGVTLAILGEDARGLMGAKPDCPSPSSSSSSA